MLFFVLCFQFQPHDILEIAKTLSIINESHPQGRCSCIIQVNHYYCIMERNVFLIMSVGRVMRRLFAFFSRWKKLAYCILWSVSAFVDIPATETNELRIIQRYLLFGF